MHAICSVKPTRQHKTRFNRRLQRVKTWKFGCEFLLRNALLKDKAALGKWTCDQLVDLGPTFVKLGQIAGSRSDIYPVEFTRELERLQDNVPAVRFEEIAHCVDISCFDAIDETPFKSASIGQVHRATLHGGQEVVVKIRRPGIVDRMRADTQNVRELVRFLEGIGVDTGTGANQYVLEESIDNLLLECDYRNEISNAVQFRKDFKKVPWVKIPKVYGKLSNDDAIVMEYVASEKFGDIADPRVNKKNVAQALMKSYVMQTMQNGMFHADPHPGNVGFRNSNGGQIVFYDFGLVIPIDETLRSGLFDAVVPLMTKDSRAVVEIMTKLGMIVPTSDPADIETFFDLIINYLETLDVKSMGEDLMSDPIMLELARDKPFIIPSEFIYLAKAFTLAEGLLVSLDPEFNYYDYLKPIIVDNMPQVQVDFVDAAASVAEVPSRVRAISKALASLEKSRSNLKRQMKKNRNELRYAQYSIILLMVAFEVRETSTPAFAVFSAASAFFQVLRFRND